MSVTTSTSSSTSSRALVASSWALFLSLGLLMVGNGLQGSLIGVRTQVESFNDLATGFIITGYYAGFLLGSWIIPRLLREVGHIRVFVGLASLVSTTVLMHAVLVTPLAWILLRFGTGLAMAGLYVTVESWLHSRATNENRGRIMALYMFTLTGALIAGQGLLGVADVGGYVLFIVASVLVSMAVIPMALSPIPTPDFDLPESLPIRELYKLAPLGVVAGFLTGASNGALIGMTAVWASAAGLSPSRVGVLVAAGLLGSLVLLWPLGALSDRLPRRRVIFGVAVIAVVVAIYATGLEARSPLMIMALFIYGGVTYPMYSLSASHINDSVPPGKLIAAASGFVFITGLGAVVGPLVVAGLIALLGPTGFFWALAGLLFPVALYSMWRVFKYVAPTELPYIPMPLRSTPLIVSSIIRKNTNGK